MLTTADPAANNNASRDLLVADDSAGQTEGGWTAAGESVGPPFPESSGPAQCRPK